MILIDTNNAIQKLVLTLTEKTTVDVPAYQLAFTNDATKEAHSIALFGATYSNSRYDLFELATTLFDGMPTGYYTYTMYQDEAQTLPIEVGKLLIKGNAESFEIITPITNNEYIIYK